MLNSLVVSVNNDERDSLDPVRHLVYLGYAEDWSEYLTDNAHPVLIDVGIELPQNDKDDGLQRFTSPPASRPDNNQTPRIIEVDEYGLIVQPTLANYENIPEILSIKKVQYNLHELSPPLEGILLECEKSALYHFWKLLVDSMRKRLEDAIKCPICDEGARFGTEFYMTAFVDEEKPALASQHMMSSHVYNDLGYCTLDQLDDISNIDLAATNPLQWVKSKASKLHIIEDAYWKEELLGKVCEYISLPDLEMLLILLGPGKREATVPRRRNLAGDYFGFNLRKDREQKRDDFRKRVASAAGVINPDLKKRRKTVRAFDAEGRGIGKGQYVREGKYIRKKNLAPAFEDESDDGDVDMDDGISDVVGSIKTVDE